MDKIAEKLTVWFGSTPFIAFHAVWFIVWYALRLDIQLLTNIVSLEAIFLALFILRGQNIQSTRQEDYIKQAVRDTKKDLKMTGDILKKVKE